MQRRRPPALERRDVTARGVAGMAVEAIFWIMRVEASHQRIARDFGDDRGRGDRQRDPIAADHRPRLATEPVGDVAAIDQSKIGPQSESAERARHRPQSGPANVEGVDLARAREGDSDAQRLVENGSAQLFAALGAQGFGILDPLRQIAGVEDDGSDGDGPRQRTASDFVDACDPTRAKPYSLALEAEMGADLAQARGPLRRRARSKA